MFDIKGPSQIGCVGQDCSRVLGYLDFRQLLDQESFARYERLLLCRTLSRDENFRWCLNPDCGSGQFFETNSVDKAEGCTSFQCHHCKNINCLRHERIHDGATCDLFEGSMAAYDMLKAEKHCQRTVAKTTKICPGCSKRFERAGGCPHIVCECGQHFCYMCLTKYTTLTEAIIFDGARVPQGFDLFGKTVMPRHDSQCSLFGETSVKFPDTQHLTEAFVAAYVREVETKLAIQAPHLELQPRYIEGLPQVIFDRISSITQPEMEFPQLARDLSLAIEKSFEQLPSTQQPMLEPHTYLDPALIVDDSSSGSWTRYSSQRGVVKILHGVERTLGGITHALEVVERCLRSQRFETIHGFIW